MAKMKVMLVLFCIGVVLGSCKKYDAEKQAAKDEEIIANFVASNKIAAMRHSSGIYYQILAPGSGNQTINTSSTVTVNYEGRFLDGSVFDKSTTAITFPLSNVITGWQIGVPLIQKGGKIRLIIPSTLAYGESGRGSIPSNAVLDFTIELINVQ